MERFAGTHEVGDEQSFLHGCSSTNNFPFTAVISCLRLHRMTSMEREEKEKVKKREKKLEDEETLQQATWVKYTIPIKHQVKSAKGNLCFCRSRALKLLLVFEFLPRCGSRRGRSTE